MVDGHGQFDPKDTKTRIILDNSPGIDHEIYVITCIVRKFMHLTHT